MSQSQNAIVESKKHKKRNKAYNMTLLTMPAQFIIKNSDYNPYSYNEEHILEPVQNCKTIAQHHQNTCNMLCQHGVNIIADQDQQFNNTRILDNIILFVALRVVMARDLIIDNPRRQDGSLAKNIVTIRVNVPLDMNVHLLPECLDILSNLLQMMFNNIRQRMITPAQNIKKPKYNLILDKFRRMRFCKFNQNNVATLKIADNNGLRTRIVNNTLALSKRFNTCYMKKEKHLSYRTLTSKLNPKSIVEILKKVIESLHIYNSGIYDDTKTNVMSIRRQNWHVRNVSQGYVLIKLLKKWNIAFLNYIKTSYFIIITSGTYTTTRVDLNLKLTSNIVTCYVSIPKKRTLNSTVWNIKHERILSKSIKYSFCVYIPHDKKDKQTDTDTIECDISPSYFEFRNSLSVDNYSEMFSEFTDKTNTLFAKSEIFHIESKGGLKHDSELHINDSVITIMHIKEIMSESCIYTLRKTFSITNFHPRTPSVRFRKPSDMHGVIVILAKAFLPELFKKAITVKTFLGIPHFQCDWLVNESIFNNTVFGFIKSISQCFTHFKSQMFGSILKIFDMCII